LRAENQTFLLKIFIFPPIFPPLALCRLVWGHGGFGATAKKKVRYKMLDKYEFSQNLVKSDGYRIPP
jgi:hypothetical protein